VILSKKCDIFAPVVDLSVVVGHEGATLATDIIALSSTPASATVDDAEAPK